MASILAPHAPASTAAGGRSNSLFASFGDPSSAEKALRALDGLPYGDVRAGRTVHACYATDPAEPAAAPVSVHRDAPACVSGLQLLPDFITGAEESALLRLLDARWERGAIKTRAVCHFGYAFDYECHACPPGSERLAPPMAALSAAAPGLLERIASLLTREGLPVPDQATANQYLPGQGIAAHVDTVGAFADGICSLSLGADTVMQFKQHEQRAGEGEGGVTVGGAAVEGAGAAGAEATTTTAAAAAAAPAEVDVLLRRRSLLVMGGDARFVWAHGIHARCTDVLDGAVLRRGCRASLTFRRVLKMA